MIHGKLETIDGRPALRFERTYPHSVERVWRAVSVPAELERWFPAAVPWTPAKGETFEAAGSTVEVTEVDTLSAQTATGWEVYLSRLDPHLAGDHISEQVAHERWAEIHEQYAELFGVDPEPGRRFAAGLRASQG